MESDLLDSLHGDEGEIDHPFKPYLPSDICSTCRSTSVSSDSFLCSFKTVCLGLSGTMSRMHFISWPSVSGTSIMLFSATMPTEIVNIATKHMKMPVRTEIAPPGTAADLVTQEVFVVKGENKFKMLLSVLKDYSGSILMFTRTKRGAAKVKAPPALI